MKTYNTDTAYCVQVTIMLGVHGKSLDIYPQMLTIDSKFMPCLLNKTFERLHFSFVTERFRACEHVQGEEEVDAIQHEDADNQGDTLLPQP